MADHPQKRIAIAELVPTRQNPHGGAGGDVTPPTIGNFDPAPGSTIESNTPIAFDVTDDQALRRVAIVVTQRDQKLVVHDGDGFSSGFRNYSTRTPTSGGWRYSVRRDGGWLSTPVFEVIAIDTSGNEA